jgi:hypothetical protein
LRIDRFTRLGCHNPATTLLAEVSGSDTGVELDIFLEVQPIRDEVQPLLCFGLRGNRSVGCQDL